MAAPTHAAELASTALPAPAAASPLPDILNDFFLAEGAEIVDLLAFRHARAAGEPVSRPMPG